MTDRLQSNFLENVVAGTHAAFNVSEGRIFKPKLIVITNLNAVDQLITLEVDGDTVYPRIEMDGESTLMLHEEDLLGLTITDDGLDIVTALDDVDIYVAGVEIGAGRNRP